MSSLEYKERPQKCEVEGCNNSALALFDLETNRYVYEDTRCVLHCSKTNKYWIQNYNEVKEQLEKREHGERINIKWNHILLNAFMKEFNKWKPSYADSFDIKHMEIPKSNLVVRKLQEVIKRGQSSVSIVLDSSKIFDSLNINLEWSRKISISIQECDIYGDLKIVQANCYQLKIEKLYVRGNLYIESLKFEPHTNVEKEVRLSDVRCAELNMSQVESSEHYKVFINYIKANQISIRNSTFKGYTSISYPQIEEFSMEDVKVQEEFHVCSPEGGKIGHLYMCGLNVNECSVSICDIELNTLHITRTITKPRLFRVSGVRSVKRLIMKDTVIENFILQSVSLENTTLELENINAADFRFNSVEWGEINSKKVCPELMKRDPGRARDIYRQIKFALDNQKDFITANYFYALEMEAYSRAIRKKLRNLRYWNPLKGRLWENLRDMVVFSLYGCISKYGQTWIRPLLGIILTTLIASYLLYGLPKEPWHAVENFFKTLNLLKLKNTKSDDASIDFYYTISSLHALLTAYLTYQLIVAVRRKTKR